MHLSRNQSLQNYIRDSGILRSAINLLTRTVLGPAFYFENPKCFPQFIRISEYPHFISVTCSNILQMFKVKDDTFENTKCNVRANTSGIGMENVFRVNFEKVRYHSQGRDFQQRAQVMVRQELLDSKDAEIPLMIFMHGGAWGSGFGTMYRLISLPFLERNYRVVILNYRTFPDGNMEQQQMEDLIQAVDYFKERYHGDDGTRGKVAPVVLCTHSSGAHIGMMTALKNYNLNQKVDGMICMSGVYNLERVRKLDMENGLQNISPMGPASHEKLKEYSPVQILLESTIMEQAESTLDSFPPLLLLHGKDDEVAPYHFSIELHSVLEKYHPHVDVELEVLDGVGHQDTVLETCLGKGRTQSIIFDWLDGIVE